MTQGRKETEARETRREAVEGQQKEKRGQETKVHGQRAGGEDTEVRRNREGDTQEEIGAVTGTRVWEREARDKGTQALDLDTLFGVAPTVPWRGSGSSRRSGARVLPFSSPPPGRALAGPGQVQRLGQGLPQGQGLAQGLAAGPRKGAQWGPRPGSEAMLEAGLRLSWTQGSGSWGTSGLAGLEPWWPFDEWPPPLPPPASTS